MDWIKGGFFQTRSPPLMRSVRLGLSTSRECREWVTVFPGIWSGIRIRDRQIIPGIWSGMQFFPLGGEYSLSVPLSVPRNSEQTNGRQSNGRQGNGGQGNGGQAFRACLSVPFSDPPRVIAFTFSPLRPLRPLREEPP
jgi:hypothetical protein